MVATKRKKRAVRAPAIASSVVETLAVLLIERLPLADVERSARKMGVAAALVPEAIRQARQRIQLAADYDLAHEIGTAYLRLNEIYRRALEDVPDMRVALAAQRELNRLLALYKDTSAADADRSAEEAAADIDGDAQAAREQLAALRLAGADAPLAELARRAVARIMELEARR